MTPIGILGGNRSLYFSMLSRLEPMSLNHNIVGIAEAVDSNDYDKMKSKVHNLKGACGYVGASRMHYACYWIQDAHFHGLF